MAELIINDKKLWKSLVRNNIDIDVFFKPEYSKLFEENGDGESNVAIYYESKDNYILYPYLIRKVNETCYYDITSPYGYGGFYQKGGNELVKDFQRNFYKYCKNNNIITEFIRFHLFQSNHTKYCGNIKNTHLNLFVNTTKIIETLYNEYHRSVRKNIRIATNSGCEVIIDNVGERLKDFYEIYIDTMKRNSANDYYLFKLEFFQKLLDLLKGNFIFFHVQYNDEIIATELVLYSKKYAYSFLGGTDSEYFELRPNDFLKHKIIEWAHEKKIEKFILGGGYSKEDGIYKYKRKFTTEPDLNFFVGNMVISENIYTKLNELYHINKNINKEDFYKKEYFPLYRS